MEVSKTLAAQIVHAVYEVVKTDTNLISPSGHIVGSTDPDRIGSSSTSSSRVCVCSSCSSSWMKRTLLREQSRESITPSFSTTLPSP